MKILFGTLDTVFATQRFPVVTERMQRLTSFYTNWLSSGFDCTIAVGTLDQLLHTANERRADYLIAQGHGHFIKDLSAIADIKAFLDEDFAVAGHILARPSEGCYPELHHQFVIINMQYFRDYASSNSLLLCVAERSVENIHDNYTPLWLKPTNQIAQYKHKGFGSDLISASLGQGHTVLNIPTELRAKKTYLYPENSTQGLDWFLVTGDRTKLEDQNQIDHFSRYDQRYAQQLVYPFNTESHYDRDRKDFAVDHIYGVSAGFKPMSILRCCDYNANTAIHHFDYSEPALDYVKTCLAEWDGTRYDEYVESKKHDYHFTGYHSPKSAQDLWLQEQRFFGNRFEQAWVDYRDREHTFTPVDLISYPDSLIRMIEFRKGQRQLVWVSNVFSSEYCAMYSSFETAKLKYADFIYRLANIDPAIVIVGDTFDQYPLDTTVGEELTRLNQLYFAD